MAVKFGRFNLKLLVVLLPLYMLSPASVWGQTNKPSYEQYLRNSIVPESTLDTFLSPNEYSMVQFDPELGYILGNYMPRDGIDQSSTISTVQTSGARTAFMYTDKTCRINTYGNSFTQSSQVSDGETWQEYLAGHLGEPVRNFGVGGYGVYQAYRRMVREEKTEHDAEYIVLYIWGDDHIRSLLRCRHALIYKVWDHAGGRLFHNNFWANLEMDLETETFIEKENLLPAPQSLYKMTDPDWMYENLKDDLALQMAAYTRGFISGIDVERVRKLGQILRFHPSRIADETPPKKYVEELLDRYSFEATKYILTKAKEFTSRNDKKLMVVLFDPYKAMKQLIANGKRYDQEVVDFLEENNFLYFDMNLVHVRDYKCFKLPLDAYMKRYFIGHYSPAGNHFFAYSVKNEIVKWLNPMPVTYRNNKQKMIHFKSYLPE